MVADLNAVKRLKICILRRPRQLVRHTRLRVMYLNAGKRPYVCIIMLGAICLAVGLPQLLYLNAVTRARNASNELERPSPVGLLAPHPPPLRRGG